MLTLALPWGSCSGAIEQDGYIVRTLSFLGIGCAQKCLSLVGRPCMTVTTLPKSGAVKLGLQWRLDNALGVESNRTIPDRFAFPDRRIRWITPQNLITVTIVTTDSSSRSSWKPRARIYWIYR